MPSSFLYEAPVVELALEPSVGVPAGGTAVVLTGRGYLPGATVTFDGVPATGISVVSSARIEATTPAHALGPVDVVVTNLDASVGTLTDGFVYETDAPETAVSYRTPAGSRGTGLRLETNAPTITQSLGQPSRCTFTAGLEPAGLQRVEYRSFGVLLFLGTVTGKTERVDGEARLQAWDTECTDRTYDLACTPHPIGSWVETSATTILAALIGGAGGFSSAGVESGLPNVTVSLDGTLDRWAAIVDVCTRAGAKVFLDGSTVYAFTVDSGFDPPDDVTEANPDLLWTEPGQTAITIAWDYLGIRNSVTVRGAEGITALLEDAASLALYGRRATTINDNTLTTIAALVARAQVELDAWAAPIPIAKYATRDLKTRAGKTVVINLTRPLISGTFIIETANIDQLELAAANPPTKPRFTVTAKPASAMMGTPGDVVGLMQTVIDLKANAAKQPKLDGDITSEPGGRTTIPDNSVPATKLAGCIGSEKLDPTGVTPATYGDAAHLPIVTVDAAGRMTGASTDPVAITKTDGSQPYTADQPMGGHTLTDLAAPTNPDDAATKDYVDVAIAASTPTGVIRADGTIAFAADESMGGHKLTNLATPATGTDAATKAYVDASIPAAAYDTILTATNPLGGTVVNETPAGAVNGSNAVFTTATAYADLRVFLNGLRQQKTTHYTETTATTFTLTTAPLTGDVLTVDYRGGAVPEVVFDSFGDVIVATVPL